MVLSSTPPDTAANTPHLRLGVLEFCPESSGQSMIGQQNQWVGTSEGCLDNKSGACPLSPREQHGWPDKRHPSLSHPSLGPRPARRAPKGGDWPRLAEDVGPKALASEPPPWGILGTARGPTRGLASKGWSFHQQSLWK
ncbi:hypothetical protein LIER_17934 [Lithospermum erythrorhizon]|uniref:Uncharacterized protein n=1 Tax=Lithospermum erythrorhizon TaxID=34254 RepID=A0AAV3QC42_LITER